MSVIGAPLTRVDGRMKVTGGAKYSAEFQMAQLAYAVLVQSTIPAGQIDQTRMNVDGGAISLGHPVGCSGNRIVLHLVNAMKRLGTKRGIATECIGGGQGGAMLIESV